MNIKTKENIFHLLQDNYVSQLKRQNDDAIPVHNTKRIQAAPLDWKIRGPNLWCRNNVSTQMCWTWLVYKQFLRIRKVQKQTIITEEGNHYSVFFYHWGPLQIKHVQWFHIVGAPKTPKPELLSKEYPLW